MYKLPFLELVLSDSLFFSKLNNEELEMLRGVAINKYAIKIENFDVYGLSNIKKTMLLAAIIIDKQEKAIYSSEEKELIKNFIKNYNRFDSSLLTEVSKIIIKESHENN